MEIYVDKLPESCDDCRFRHDYKTEGFYGCHAHIYIASEKLCPLKQLSNAQLAVGWLENGIEIESDTSEGKNFVADPNMINFNILTTYKWKIKTKPQYTLTDWEGARKAVKDDKKVTHKGRFCYYTLHVSREYARYRIRDEHGENVPFTDELYDSKEWKIWEK